MQTVCCYLIVETYNITKVRVDSNATVGLPCRSSRWLFKSASSEESRSLTVDGRRLMFETTADQQGLVTMLNIHQLVLSDSGIYTCIHGNHLHQYVVTLLSSSGTNQPLFQSMMELQAVIIAVFVSPPILVRINLAYSWSTTVICCLSRSTQDTSLGDRL